MSHRFLLGVLLTIVGLVLLTVCWVMRKRDDSLYVETEVTDGTYPRLSVVDDDERGAA